MDTILLKQRDRYSLELKARYLIRDSRGRFRDFGLRLYFFFPRSFNLSPVTYSPQEFYDQLKLNLRFNTPRFSTGELLERLTDTSPLVRVEKLLYRQRHDGIRLDGDLFLYESKMLATVFKSILRDLLLSIRERIGSGDEAKRLEEHLERDVKELHEVARRYHALLDEMEGLELPEEIVQQGRMIDEHLSLLLEKYLTSILPVADDSGPGQLYQRIVKVLLKEEKYRDRRGYPSLPSEIMSERQLEEYVYREKMLKKFASEVLFFDVDRKDATKKAEHILYAAAAGIAMILATAIAFFGQTRFGSLTASLFVLLVVGYMIKDRAKDLFRDLLRRRVGRYMSDRKTRVYDRRKRKRLATVKERTGFVAEQRLGDAVRRVRNRGYFERILSEQEEEQVLLYSKRLTLQAENIRRLHNRIHGVADINIIDLAPFLRHLTAQYGLIPTIPGKRRVQLKRVKRIYHLNLVVAYDSPEGEIVGRFRLIVDANGIKRVEPVEVPGTAPATGFRLVPPSLREEDGEFEE